MNKHKPWIETSYHGVITENTDVVLLDPPLVALDKDAPVPYAGKDTSHGRGFALRGDGGMNGGGLSDKSGVNPPGEASPEAIVPLRLYSI